MKAPAAESPANLSRQTTGGLGEGRESVELGSASELMGSAAVAVGVDIFYR